MNLSLAQAIVGALSGGLVGFTLGLFGGGGSILAVPLIVYAVGVPDAHVAIGTSALAVAANAITGLIEHARHGTVEWRCATVFTLTGVIGALLGSALGKEVESHRLLALFGVLMLCVAVLMLISKNPRRSQDTGEHVNFTLLSALGAATGACSGFFGIGGGFLIVPGLIAATNMSLVNAVGSSLLAVFAFGMTTTVSYAAAGYVNWSLVALLVGGGLIGTRLGCLAVRGLSTRTALLRSIFAGCLMMVATYLIVRGMTV